MAAALGLRSLAARLHMHAASAPFAGTTRMLSKWFRFDLRAGIASPHAHCAHTLHINA